MDRMADVDRNEWDALAGDGAGGDASPFLGWGFLALLEESLSICPQTGWTPAHFLLRHNGVLVAAAPFYVKTHSMGEFVFDMEFAQIARRSGMDWYPKLVGMAPATPVPAWRVLVAPGEDAPALASLVIEGAQEAARAAGLKGIHLLWPDAGTAHSLSAGGKAAWAEWQHQAFLWENRGWKDFDGWLSSFSKNMRRNVGRERKSVREAGITTRMIDAGEAAATPGLLALFADLYESHNVKFGPWAAKFLTREFFLRLPEFMPDGWCLAAGFEEAAPEALPVALAFLFEGGGRLYGRYYGASREVSGLHFELCYYRPVEYAIEKGMSAFDPGMGSPHKARRGFTSFAVPSFHRPFDKPLLDFMVRVLPEVNEAENAQIAALNEELPYRKDAH